MSRVLLLGAGGPAGENFCRSVQMAGHEVIGVDPDPWALALSSAEFVGLTAKDMEGIETDFVHAQPDQEVLRLALNPPTVYASLVPDAAAIRLSQDKLATAGRLEDLAPRSMPVLMSYDVPQVFGLGNPVWFRARRGAGSMAALPVDNEALGITWFDYWNARGVEMMASTYLPGRNLSWTGVYSRDGEMVASATKERIELLGASRAPSGVSSTARVQRIVHRPDVAEIARETIRRLTPNPRGVFMVDLREDEHWTPKVTEVNAGRFGTTSLFFAETGGNLPAVLVALATGEDPPCMGEDVCEIGAVQVRNTDMGSRVLSGVAA